MHTALCLLTIISTSVHPESKQCIQLFSLCLLTITSSSVDPESKQCIQLLSLCHLTITSTSMDPESKWCMHSVSVWKNLHQSFLLQWILKVHEVCLHSVSVWKSHSNNHFYFNEPWKCMKHACIQSQSGKATLIIISISETSEVHAHERLSGREKNRTHHRHNSRQPACHSAHSWSCWRRGCCLCTGWHWARSGTARQTRQQGS